MGAYLLLALAIAAEVTATVSLKLSEGFSKLGPSIVVVVGYAIAFAALSYVLKLGLPIGVAYAIWAAAGVALVAIIGVIFLKEPLNAAMVAGLALVIGGVVLIEVGERGLVKVQVDGRKARGDKRRAEIIAATLRVIERDGVAGVTHRTVAVEAGVPTTSTTYHFTSLDDLLIATLISCARDMATEVYWMIDRARSRGSRGAEEVAGLLAEALGPRRGRTMAEYELYLLAARKPELRPAARRWLDVLTSMVRHDDEVAFRVFLAGIDGLLIQGLIDDEPPSADELRPVVAYLLKPR